MQLERGQLCQSKRMFMNMMMDMAMSPPVSMFFCTHVLSARSTRNGSLTGQTGALRRFGLFII